MPRPKKEITVQFEVKFVPCPPEKVEAYRAGLILLLEIIREEIAEREKELFQRQITSTDKAIDSLVYELYGLSQEEIGDVEGNNQT